MPHPPSVSVEGSAGHVDHLASGGFPRNGASVTEVAAAPEEEDAAAAAPGEFPRNVSRPALPLIAGAQ
eukprot:7339967-Pyramimonas_sp.AAC.1